VSRRKGRILAFQALYSWDVGSVSPSELFEFPWTRNAKGEISDDEETRSFARLLIAGTIEHHEEIDTLIKAHISEKWDFKRLSKVSLAILRMSVYSLLYQKDTHPSVVIDEAIDIAKEFDSDDSFKFINAVLDTISKTSDGIEEG
jgi:N utilization substance protein B